jgi:wyosine [tRNA(Phe)-imidazoG37] synthetase (radical SAM superfamily)
MVTFGPVPSRRLGRSLGVNNLGPTKCCSYSCVYCQLGGTRGRQCRRRAFVASETVVAAVAERVAECSRTGQGIDHITIVPEGEPTLDGNLGATIRGLRPLGIPIAVITNGSLLWRPDVRADLAAADVVSVKVDVRRHASWRRLNRPPHSLDIASVLWGILDFARDYRGELLTETMLVEGYNDDTAAVEGVTDFLVKVQPHRAYLAVPTRPPANRFVRPPPEQAVLNAYAIMTRQVRSVELLISEEDGPFGHGDDPERDLLGILAIHPMKESAVRVYLQEIDAPWDIVDHLLERGRLVRIEYQDVPFLLRRIRRGLPAGAAVH